MDPEVVRTAVGRGSVEGGACLESPYAERDDHKLPKEAVDSGAASEGTQLQQPRLQQHQEGPEAEVSCLQDGGSWLRDVAVVDILQLQEEEDIFQVVYAKHRRHPLGLHHC